MPYRDGTGPAGLGAGTGRGMGGCLGGNYAANAKPFGMGLRRGRGCGLGAGYRFFPAQEAQTAPETKKAILTERKQQLEAQLAAVNRSLEEE